GMTGAGYMTVRNHGKQPQTLVRIESPAARKVEMHRSVVAGGVARMEAVPQLTIAPGAEARFAPGGMHLMLVGLVKAQAAGQRIPATLVFASGARVKGDMIVGGAAPPEKGGSTHNH
ncbi:MAG TPA: copper chaperone PCu(A)C, partial [Phenylobacterium sp.]